MRIDVAALKLAQTATNMPFLVGRAIDNAENGVRMFLAIKGVSLEHVLCEFMAQVSGISASSILHRTVTEDQKDLIIKRVKDWQRRVYQQSGSITIQKFDADASVQEMESAANEHLATLLIVS